MVIKFGRFGRFLACSGYPECRNTKTLKEAPQSIGMKCPGCSEGEVVIRKTKSDLVRQAYNFAKSAHVGQKRLSGEPYFNHALETAEALADWKLDEVTIAAGLLHDVIEDTKFCSFFL